MEIWRRIETRLDRQSDDANLGSIFLVVLAFFIALLVAIGSLLRFLW
jgi:hypothetical protein